MMPIYTYSCPRCEKVFDVEKSMTAPHPIECPFCNIAGELSRVFAIPAILFRGSGFYTTDKVVDEITDPEYQLTHEEQIEYYDEKLKDERVVKVFT